MRAAALRFCLSFALLRAKPALLHVKKASLDPHCREGLVNTEMTTCCQADCGECSDVSKFCVANNTLGRESTCCPTVMLSGELDSCEVSMAPCAIPDFVRNPEAVVMPEVHAMNDCGEAEKDMRDLIDLNTHYVKFVDKKTTPGATAECGEYGTTAQASAACSNNGECIGFTFKEDKPDCLVMTGDELEALEDEAGTEVYVKREDGFTGHRYNLQHGATEACSASCGGGNQTVELLCVSGSGTAVRYGMCSAQVLMNEDGIPSDVVPCNEDPCAPPNATNATA
jgi:hypothetical protein